MRGQRSGLAGVSAVRRPAAIGGPSHVNRQQDHERAHREASQSTTAAIDRLAAIERCGRDRSIQR